jgi:hypothetical protein
VSSFPKGGLSLMFPLARMTKTLADVWEVQLIFAISLLRALR